jgi:hypothetical protein
MLSSGQRQQRSLTQGLLNVNEELINHYLTLEHSFAYRPPSIVTGSVK